MKSRFAGRDRTDLISSALADFIRACSDFIAPRAISLKSTKLYGMIVKKGAGQQVPQHDGYRASAGAMNTSMLQTSPPQTFFIIAIKQF